MAWYSTYWAYPLAAARLAASLKKYDNVLLFSQTSEMIIKMIIASIIPNLIRE